MKARKGRVRIRKKELRGSVTHVAIIADRPEVQNLLPQVFIGNHHRFTLGLVAACVHLFRKKSSWNNKENMRSILELVAEAFGHFAHLQPILLLDTVRCHIAPSILQKAGALNLWMASVPAGLTYLLQPLDVSGFAGYKRFLREQYRCARLETGSVSPEQWMRLLFQVCVEFLNRTSWASAFRMVGVGAHEAQLSAELQSIFPHGRPSRGASLTAGELARILPHNSGLRPIEFARAALCRRRLLNLL